LDDISDAKRILREWKGDSYVFGEGVIGRAGSSAALFGKDAILVASGSAWAEEPRDLVESSLEENGVSHHPILNSGPNAPREDLYRIALQLALYRPDLVVAFGGGSTIDACKAASVLASYTSEEVSRILEVDWPEAGTIDPYFGTGMVTKMEQGTGRTPIPVVAVQTAASSAAHLTKYSNITDPLTGQKKLIVDDAIVPDAAIFDYEVTLGAPRDLTLDGGMDGISHLWEVYMGATGKDNYEKIEEVVVAGIRLIVRNLRAAADNPEDQDARNALGLGTDLGGYAIMLGGTNGPHLGSFSLVDVLTHGRACAVLLPYYTVLFASAIQDQLSALGSIFKEEGYMEENLQSLNGRDLGEAVAKGIIRFIRSLGFPTTLREAGASREHLDRMVDAAKNPQLRMKLLNMPIPLDPDRGDIERYMRSVLEAAFKGDLEEIETLETQI